ncbi:hypothetical protein PN36_22380 [Candidatus Thiomargarita nelsonii]|uniref:Uncharacterized protein n=1 Tax=Candidatus Thiomargarita nelsonii TaxID=1003181 RepID=A0A0A6PEY2_9GAMM|nr:hypothetical protein PN36_22380 [Candidatus Thiomargarita nelsonii]
MEIEQTTLKKGIHINFNVKPPTEMDLNRINQHQIQYAFNAFFNAYFQQHPEVLESILTNSDHHQPTEVQIPKISKQQREVILASIKETPDYDDVDSEKWIQEVQSSRKNVIEGQNLSGEE